MGMKLCITWLSTRRQAHYSIGRYLIFGFVVSFAQIHLDAADSNSEPHFLTSHVRLWAERTQALPFAVDAPAGTGRHPEIRVADTSIVGIIRTPEILAGERLGFVRLIARRTGKTELQMGNARLTVEVSELAPTERVDTAAHVPRIMTPVMGACVWGRFSVGVDLLDDAAPNRGEPNLRLKLPSGRVLEPTVVTPRSLSAMRHACFEVDAAELLSGPGELIALNGPVESTPVRVVALHPKRDRIRDGECEDTVNGVRPARWKPTPPKVVADAEASGGKAVACFSPDPAWCLPLDVSVAGYYQLALVARGTLAGGALPSMGVYVNEGEQPVSNSNLAGVAWHRVVVGRPIHLDAGENIVTVRFENDFFANRESDRNLWLDRYELVRVVDGRSQPPGLSTLPSADKAPPALAMNEAPAPLAGAMEPEERAAAEVINTEASALATLQNGLQVALILPRNDRRVITTAPVRVEGWCRGEAGKEPLRTTLLLNGKPAGIARGHAPSFHISPAQLLAGANRLQLETTRTDGTRAQSAVQSLWREAVLRDEAPIARIRYPEAGQTLFESEVVLADLQPGEKGCAWVELSVDGQAYGPRILDPVTDEPIVMALPLHSLEAGEHEFRVRAAVTPDGKMMIESDPRMIKVETRQAAVMSERSRYARAVYLLDRFGFGAEPRELGRLMTEGEERWLDERLSDVADPARATAWMAATSLFPEMRKDDGAVVPRVLTELVLDGNPVRLRFSLWAENHFSTWIQKTGARAKWTEHRMYARLGVAPFAELLLASATSPAMLQYLDQPKSFAGRINENYARELLELHTVGVGSGYSQNDVTHLATILTGWMTADAGTLDPVRGPQVEREFRFDPVLNDGASQTVFGILFQAAGPEQRFDRVRFELEVLAAHPATARFICQKLAAHYVASPPPAALVEAMTKLYLETGGDLRAVLRDLPRHQEFWSAPQKMTSPLDFALRLARISGNRQPGPLNDFLRRSGMGIFDRQSPDGYPESDSAYTDSNALSQRWRFAQGMALPAFDAGDDTPLAPRDPAVARAEKSAAIQFAAVRLTGRPLTAASTHAAEEMLDFKTGERRAEFMRRAAQVVAQLPEVQLR